MAAQFRRTTENLSCPVCYQLFRNPRFLQCYHSYCEQCLESMARQSRITCPECRKVTTLPAGGVMELPVNFQINGLIDSLIRNTAGQERKNCDICSNDEVSAYYCPSCNTYLCYACGDIHKEDQTCCEPSVVLLGSIDPTRPQEFLCEEHGYESKHFCETCDKLVCLYCTSNGKPHSSHEHDTVEKMAIKYRTDMRKVTTPLGEVTRALLEASNTADNLRKTIQDQSKEIDLSIEQHYEGLIQRLLEQKRLLKEELSVAVSQVVRVISVREQEIKSVQGKLEEVQELNDSVEKGSDQYALFNKHHLIEGVRKLDVMYKELCSKPVISHMVAYTPANQPLPQFGQLSVFGKPFSLGDSAHTEVEKFPSHIFVDRDVQLRFISKDRNGRLCPIGGSQMSAQLESNSGEVSTVQVADNLDGSYTASFIPQQVGKARLSVCLDGRHISESPFCFTAFKNYLALNCASNVLSTGGDFNLGNPWGIALSKNGLWAVADNTYHCVYIFDGENQLIRKIGDTGSRKGQFQSPRGVAFDDDNNVYVADHSNHRIQKFSANGQYLMQFGNNFSLTLGLFYKMSFPTGVTAYSNRIYVAEKSSKGCVSVFQNNGRFCFTIGANELCGPYDLTVSADGRLLIADCTKNRIYVYTPDGDILQSFGTGGTGMGQLNSPFSLAVDLNLFIFVADTWNHRVAVFDRSGNCIHCFGSEGCNGFQLQRPHGIALNREGRVYVSDHGNSRILVF